MCSLVAPWILSFLFIVPGAMASPPASAGDGMTAEAAQPPEPSSIAEPDDPIPTDEILTDEALAGETLFESVRLPYAGPGEVSVLNDGELALRVLGTWVPDPRPDPETGKIGVYLCPREVRHLVVDRDCITLAAADGEWFLDEDGRYAATRGLARDRIAMTPFEEVADDTAPRESLVDFDGELVITYDPKTGIYRVQASDQERGDRFTLAFRRCGKYSPPEPAKSSSACSATCPKGSCDISCVSPLWAKCYCTTKGVPVCVCVPDAEMIELEEWP